MSPLERGDLSDATCNDLERYIILALVLLKNTALKHI